MIDEISKHSFWPAHEDYYRYMHDQFRIGTRLESLIPDPAKVSSSEPHSLHDCSDNLLRHRIPFALAFGYQNATMWQTLLASTVSAGEPVAKVCSLYNLGIALFDRILDRNVSYRPLLFELLDERTLEQLLRNDGAIESALWIATDHAPAEIRILSDVVIAFFKRFHDLGLSTDARDIIAESIRLSYAAEMASTVAVPVGPGVKWADGRDTSVTPFLTLYLLVQHSMEKVLKRSQDLTQLAEAIGEVFWLTDDLCDLVEDLESVHPNSVLASVLLDERPEPHMLDRVALQSALIDGNQIESAARDLAKKIESLLELGRSYLLSERQLLSIRELATMYVIDWGGLMPRRDLRS
ncbi:MAG: hypothetical protein KOO62_08985 [candidate division Zixibacteria bacterium]|nr:hypothetical protein [candidate division Zixibacteria bacterium]